MSSELGCLFYLASNTEEEKDRILGSWIESKGWIIATTALGQGLNFSGILHIVHCGRPYTLSGALQQGGGGGRGGEISYHTIIEDVARTCPMKREVISKGSPKDIEETALTAFIQATECRRVVLAHYMDGDLGPEATDCRSLDYVLCDWCESQARHELIEREHRKRAQRNRELEELSIHERRVENRVENRALSDFALRVEAPYSEEFNALGMRVSNASHTPGSHAPRSHRSHAPGIQESHALGSYRSHAPGSHRSHALGSHRSHAPRSHRSHAPGIQESNALGIQESNAPGIQESNAPGIQESYALVSYSYGFGSHRSYALGSQAPSTNAFETPLSGAPNTELSSQVISQKLYTIEQANETLIANMNILRGKCYYCICYALENSIHFKHSNKREHLWRSCIDSYQNKRKTIPNNFKKWKVDLKFSKNQCRECGLPLSICRRLDRGTKSCDYIDIMLPILFIVYKASDIWLESKVRELGFQGEVRGYSIRALEQLIEWWCSEEVCFGSQ